MRRNQKYNLASASGDIPDFLETVPETIFLKMVRGRATGRPHRCLRPVRQPALEDHLARVRRPALDLVQGDGRIYGISRVEDLAHNDCVMWYRQDWFDKAGQARAHDLRGGPRCWRWPLPRATMAWAPRARPSACCGATPSMPPGTAAWTFSGAATAYLPHHWQPEGDKLMYGATRPEMKEALAVLAQWYKDGVFAKDFYTYDTSKAMQNVAANLDGLPLYAVLGRQPG